MQTREIHTMCQWNTFPSLARQRTCTYKPKPRAHSGTRVGVRGNHAYLCPFYGLSVKRRVVHHIRPNSKTSNHSTEVRIGNLSWDNSYSLVTNLVIRFLCDNKMSLLAQMYGLNPNTLRKGPALHNLYFEIELEAKMGSPHMRRQEQALH